MCTSSNVKVELRCIAVFGSEARLLLGTASNSSQSRNLKERKDLAIFRPANN